MSPIDISPLNANFLECCKQAAEYSPDNPKYEQSLQWNVGHIDRGEEDAAAVSKLRANAGSRVLEVGCGSGGVCIAFAREGARCTGVKPGALRVSRACVRTCDHGVNVAEQIETLGLRKLLKAQPPNAVAHRLVSWLTLKHTHTFVAKRAG